MGVFGEGESGVGWEELGITLILWWTNILRKCALLTRGGFSALTWIFKGACKQTHWFILSQLTQLSLSPAKEKRNSGNVVPVEISFTSDFRPYCNLLKRNVTICFFTVTWISIYVAFIVCNERIVKHSQFFSTHSLLLIVGNRSNMLGFKSKRELPHFFLSPAINQRIKERVEHNDSGNP